jgi:CRP-like cAMP-binding protein
MTPMDVDRLASLPLFGELDHHDLSQLASKVREVRAGDGDTLMEQGALPKEVLVIEDGAVDIIHDDLLIAKLGRGDVVGEIGLIDPQRRTATVRAAGTVRAVALGFDAIATLDEEMPEISRTLRAIARRRLDQLDAGADIDPGNRAAVGSDEAEDAGSVTPRMPDLDDAEAADASAATLPDPPAPDA